jgi:hypothetical protein
VYRPSLTLCVSVSDCHFFQLMNEGKIILYLSKYVVCVGHNMQSCAARMTALHLLSVVSCRCISGTCAVRQGGSTDEESVVRPRGWSRSRTLSVSYIGAGMP